MKTTNTKVLLFVVIIYTVFSFIFERLIESNAEITHLLNLNDILISLIILVTFFVDLRKSKNKRSFMKFGWIYLIASVPAIGLFTTFAPYLRLLRLLLVIRFMKNSKDDPDRAINPIYPLIMVGGLLLFVCSTLILYFENVPDGNIKTTIDAIYWSVVTVATVGYGDLYPVTDAGKIISIIMIFSGAGIFVSIAGSFASFISTRHLKQKKE